MSKPAKGGLGRGLGSLVGGAPVEQPSVPAPAAPVGDLVPTPGAIYV